jgi:hypothetical protein
MPAVRGAADLAPAGPVVRGTGLIACAPHRANPVVNDQEVVPGLVELEVAVPHLSLAVR